MSVGRWAGSGPTLLLLNFNDDKNARKVRKGGRFSSSSVSEKDSVVPGMVELSRNLKTFFIFWNKLDTRPFFCLLLFLFCRCKSTEGDDCPAESFVSLLLLISLLSVLTDTNGVATSPDVDEKPEKRGRQILVKVPVIDGMYLIISHQLNIELCEKLTNGRFL